MVSIPGQDGLSTGESTITVITDNNITDKCVVKVMEEVIEEDDPEWKQKIEISASVSSGSVVKKGTKIELSSVPSAAHIYYTLDGSKPVGDYAGNHKNGTHEYSEPILISENTVIKATASLYGYQSDEETYTYTVNEWNAIDPSMRNDIFDGDSGKIPKGIWYAFEGDNHYYLPNDQPQIIQVNKNHTGGKVAFNEEISVFYGTERLVEGRDYKVSYSYNVNTANASLDRRSPTVIIKGTGGYYKGSSEFRFTISGEAAVAKNVKVVCLNKEPVYTGKYLTFEELNIALYNETDGKRTELHKDVDYRLVNRPGKYGTFTLRFELLKGAGGTVESEQITVKPYDVKKHVKAGDSKVKWEFDKQVEFNKSGAEPKVTVKFELADSDVIELQEGLDYTVSCSKNKKLNARAKLKIKFTGCFKGTITDYYEISDKKDVSQLTVYAEDIKWKDKPGNFKVLPQVLDNSKTVSKRKDIEKFSKTEGCEYYYASGYRCGDRIDDNEAVPAGTVIEVRVNVKSRNNGAYKGTAVISGYYRVYDNEMNIKKAVVSPNPIIIDYDEGNKIIPVNKNDFELIMPGSTEPLSSDCFEIVSAQKNRFIGTATIKIRGKNGYGGTKTFRVKIVKRKM